MLTQWTVFLKTEVGRRSLQSAFSFPLEVDPLAYHRILRLPLAKGVIPIWAAFFIWHILSPIETFAKVEAMSESRSIEDLPIVICCSFEWIPVFS